MDTFLHLNYLAVSSITSYYLYKNENLFFCIGIVFYLLLNDFIIHFLNLYKLRKDMIIHHIFSIIIIVFFLQYFQFLYKNPIALNIIRTLLSFEISTIFLSINNLFPKGKYTTIKSINQLFFITTFLYFRIYKFTIEIILDGISLEYIKRVAQKNYFWIIYSIYGLYALNLFWTFTILKKIHKSLI